MSERISDLANALWPEFARRLAAGGVAVPAGGGTSDHGRLAGLLDDDHPHYLTAGRGDGRYTTLAAFSAHAADPAAHHAPATAGDGIALTGQQVRVLRDANSGLAITLAGALTLGTPISVSVSSTNVLSGVQHGHAVVSSSSPGATAALLATDGSGYLTLVRLVLSDRLRTPTIDTASGNLTIQPAGDIVVDPVGNDVLPATNYDINLGALSKKYLTLHAAELWVETLVAQNTIATIGGRILVGPTTYLSRDMGTGDTTIYVRHNQMVSGDRAYMEADGKVEFFAITSGPTTISATEFSYTVSRNLDGTGANAWYAGDAMFNTGQAGNGFIDLYSLRGVKSSSQAGPTIVGNIRNSSTFNDWSEAWAIGNLNGLYGYGANTVGVGLGKYASGQPNIVIDPTNGVRLRQYTTDMIVLDASGNSYFAGVMTIGTGGEIRQGTGTLGSNYTGLRIWRDSNVGRIGGYASNVLQWYGDTAGNLVAGTGYVTLNASGIDVASYHDSRTSTPEPGYSGPISNPTAALTYHASDQGEAWYSAIDGWKTYNGGTALRLFGSSRHAVDSGQYASSWSHYVDAVLEMPGVTKPAGAGSWFERLWLKAPSTSVVLVGGAVGINTSTPQDALDVVGSLRLSYSNPTLKWASNTLTMTSYSSAIPVLALVGNGYDPRFDIAKADGTTVSIRLSANSTSYFNGGNVGIYTTSPGSALDVRTGEVRVGNTSDLYSAKIQTNGNIHAQGAVTSELYLQMATASTPAAATGFVRLWFDGTNIKVILPGGTTRTLNWT